MRNEIALILLLRKDIAYFAEVLSTVSEKIIFSFVDNFQFLLPHYCILCGQRG
jgi:hypothetical protein